MTCIACDNSIRIETLKQLFALKPLLLCGRCSEYLIPKSTEILYEDNEWIRTIIDRLNQGDLVLIQLFKRHLQKALIKKGTLKSKMIIIESKEALPYPWLEILVESIIKKDKKIIFSPSRDELLITVEKQKNVKSQISLIG
ncbi:MAG: hypothetical protein FWG67_08675 [Defluviitaleaceae bacterium]|nr:hypothetical protein [Defluviitaleaceae bacterium]